MAEYIRKIISAIDEATDNVDEDTAKILKKDMKKYEKLLYQAKKDFSSLVTFFEIFANVNRIGILQHLSEKSPSTWNNIENNLKLNPKTQADQLRILQRCGMVKNFGRGIGYEITAPGRKSLKVFYDSTKKLMSRLVKMGYDFPMLNEEDRKVVYKEFS